MKNLLTILPLVALCCACSSDIIDAPDKFTIGFSAKVKETRAVADINSLKTDGFSVWGRYGTTKVFDGRQVTFESPNWVYDDPEVWTLDNEYRFFAVYPIGSVVNLVENAGEWSYNLNIETSASADTDVLTALAYKNTGDVNFSPSVNLSFSHLLTKINLTITQDTDENDTDDFSITKVTLSGVRSGGTYTVSPSETADSKWSTQLEIGSASMDYVKEFSDPEPLSKEGKAMTVWSDGLMLLPQSIGSQAVKLSIEYIYKIQGSDDSESRFVEAYLPASADLWQSGKAITYSIKISEKNEISFMAPTIESWGSPQVGGTIIIK